MAMEIFLWWILIEIISIASFPVTFIILKSFRNLSTIVSKIMGIALLSYFSWMIGFAIGFTRISTAISFLILCSISLWIFKKNKKEILKSIEANKNFIINSEILFLLLFVFLCLLRMQTPELSYYEKYMDFAFLNSMVRSPEMPPPDPWFSGGGINYYYFGHFITATLTKLSGIATNFSYNLMFCSYYAIFCIMIFGLVYALTRKMRYALLAIFIIAFLGNSFGLLHIISLAYQDSIDFMTNSLNLQYPFSFINPSGNFLDNLRSVSLWPSTRIIPDTINEFPISTFFFGDLHAHYMGFAFQVLVIFLMLDIFMEGKKTKLFSISVIFLAFFIGMCGAINFWNYILYAPFLFALLFLNENKKDAIKTFLFMITLSFLFFAPFYANIERQENNINIIDNRTEIFQLLLIFSVPFFVIYYALLSNKKRLDNKTLFCIFLFSAFISVVLGTPSAFILFPILILSLILLRESRNMERFALLLIFAATLILFSTDIMVFDIYVNSRFNAVFKLFLGIWIMYGIASCFLLANMKKSRIFWAVLGILLAINFSAPFLAFANNFQAENIKTMDGTLYMKNSDPGAYYAIGWISQNIQGSPVILESPGRAYTSDSIISSNTGLPTVIGWVNHQFSWRGEWFTERENDVNTIYSTRNNSEALELLKKYNVTYIYVGRAEREKYTHDTLNKFDVYENYELLYNDTSKIYVVTYD